MSAAEQNNFRFSDSFDNMDPCKESGEDSNAIFLRSICAGLLPLQVAIDESIISVVVEKSSSFSRFDRLKINLGAFQLPIARSRARTLKKNIALLNMSQNLTSSGGGFDNQNQLAGFGVMFLLMLWPTSQSLAIQIAYEKKSELRDYMRVMGMTNAAYYMQWLLQLDSEYWLFL